VIWNVAEGTPRWNLFQTPLPVAGLYAFYWWATRGRQTFRLASVTGALALGFILGRLFLPTNVFIRGNITDAHTGRPIGGAEFYLPVRGAEQKTAIPRSLSTTNGNYSLYVSWYSDDQPLKIQAAGYHDLETNLGGRRLGQRNIARDFVLSRPVNRAWIAGEHPLNVIPVVVRTVPQSGADDVDPNLTELQVTFSMRMSDKRWSWVRLDNETFPEMTGEPRYLEDLRTCVLPVRLRPGRTYATWINVDQFQYFQSETGVPSLPYLLIFKTKD
jgi:hypothetical protein